MPDWVTPTLTDVAQDPNVCNPEKPEPARLSVLDRGQIWLGRLAVVGAVVYRVLR